MNETVNWIRNNEPTPVLSEPAYQQGRERVHDYGKMQALLISMGGEFKICE